MRQANSNKRSRRSKGFCGVQPKAPMFAASAMPKPPGVGGRGWELGVGGLELAALGVGSWKLEVDRGRYREASEIPLPSMQSYCLPAATLVNSSNRPVGHEIVTR